MDGEQAMYLALINFFWGRIKSIGVRIFRKKPLSIEEIKKQTQILFIDDEAMDSLLDNIRDAGWSVKQRKEIDNFDAEDIKNSDIIFIDYKGVSLKLTPSDEGIGLLKALRSKYPQKHLIFYSGYAGFIPGHEIHGFADGWIQKNADPWVYIERIETAARNNLCKKKQG
ncbi:MAG: hypothetical protein PHE24_06625 [Patescibacteria group bacterium]|nr:hypothetical protein [Patescibacteria group bacterium]